MGFLKTLEQAMTQGTRDKYDSMNVLELRADARRRGWMSLSRMGSSEILRSALRGEIDPDQCFWNPTLRAWTINGKPMPDAALEGGMSNGEAKAEARLEERKAEQDQEKQQDQDDPSDKPAKNNKGKGKSKDQQPPPPDDLETRVKRCEERLDDHDDRMELTETLVKGHTQALDSHGTRIDAVGSVAEAVGNDLRKLEQRFEKLTAPLIVHRVTPEGVKVSQIDSAHRSLRDAVARINAGRSNLMLVGPAGSGKTTLARHLAEALGLPFFSISLSGATSEAALLGRIIPNLATGQGEYHTTPFVEAMRAGGVILLDELDGADANALICLNSAMGGGVEWVTTPKGERVIRHKNCIVVGAANTFGTGGNRVYVGRNPLDGAFLSRFAGGVMEIGYDTVLEEALVAARLTTTNDADAWIVATRKLRKAIEDRGMRRVLGTREVIAGADWIAYRTAGGPERVALPFDYAMTEAFEHLMCGWTDDERGSAGVPPRSQVEAKLATPAPRGTVKAPPPTIYGPKETTTLDPELIDRLDRLARSVQPKPMIVQPYSYRNPS